MIYAIIIQNRDELSVKRSTVHKHSDNLTFKFIRDSGFEDYKLRVYVKKKENEYIIEAKDDDTFIVDSRFLDETGWLALSFALVKDDEVNHLGIAKINIKDSFGNETTVLPEEKVIWQKYVDEEITKVTDPIIENMESSKNEVSQKHQEVMNAKSNVETNLKKVKDIKDSVENVKQDVDNLKNEIDKKVSSFNEKENELNTIIDDFNNDFSLKKQQIESDKIEIDKKIADFNSNFASSKKSITDQTASSIELIDSAKTQALNDLSESKKTIDDDISLEKTNLDNLVKNSKKEISDLVDTSLTSIRNEQTKAVNAVDGAKNSATSDISNLSAEVLENIENQKASSLNEINEAKNTAVQEVKKAGEHYQEQINALQLESAKQGQDIENLKRQVEDSEQYTSKFMENWFALQRTGKIYTVRFPLWDTSHISTGEKLGANAGLACEPSTKLIKGRNDYENIGLFKTYDVNAYVDENGVRHVSAFKGDSTYKDTDKNDVFVLGMSYYEKVWSDDQYWYYSRTDMPKEGYTIARECINRDGSIQPFAVYAKYVSSFIDGVPYSTKNRMPGRYYSSSKTPNNVFNVNNSYNGMIANYHKKGDFYCGGMTCDYKYVLTSFYLKYATLNTQSIMYGCANYNWQYKASIQNEDKNTYFPVAKSQALQIEVGSGVSVGYQTKLTSSTSTDRAYSNTHQYADDVRVLKKEDIDDNNVAIYLDVDEPFNTMPVTIADGVESEIYITSMHWLSGFSDDVLDRDGCPCETTAQLTNGRFPIVIQGIEIMVGGYETYANAFMDIVDATAKREVYIQNDASQLTTNVTTAKGSYKKSQHAIQPSKVNNWNYITRIDFDLVNGAFVQTECGQESSGTGVGFADGVYVDSASSGQREFLALGYLWNGGFAGLSCLNANNSLGIAGWHVLSRLSINGVGGELTTG